MTPAGLTKFEVGRLTRVFRTHPGRRAVKLFGSRAKGTHKPWTDVDLALWGELDELGAAASAAELDELPLPDLFDVLVFEQVRLPALREHIERGGCRIYAGDGTNRARGDLIRRAVGWFRKGGSGRKKDRAPAGGPTRGRALSGTRDYGRTKR